MRLLNNLIRAGFVLFLVLLPSAPVELHAQDHQVMQPPLRLVYGEFHPYSFTDGSGQAQGLSIDLARSLAEEIGRDITFISAANPVEQLKLLSEDRADMTSLLARNDQRMAVHDATQPLGSFRVGAFVLASHAAQNAQDLSGKRIGAVAGSIGVKAASKIPFAEIVEFPSNNALIVPLLAGEVDAVVTSGDAFLARLRMIRVDRDVRLIPEPLIEMPYGFYVSQNSGDLLTSLNRAIDNSITQADLDVLNEMWFGSPTIDARAAQIFYGFMALGLVGAIALALLIQLRQQSTRTRRLLEEKRANQLLLDALNGVDAAIAIYDKDFKAVLWNEGFARAHPTLCNRPNAGPDLREAILIPSVASGVDTTQTRIDMDIYASETMRKLQLGHTVTRIAKTASGTVFEASEFPVGDGQYASVHVDVTRLFDQAGEIERQRLQLEQANERLQIFAAMAAHDLRSPLLQQGALLDFLVEDIEDAFGQVPAEIEDQIDVIKRLSEKMQTLISELLEYSKAGQSSGPLEQIDPNRRLPGIVDLAGLAPGYQLKIDGELPRVFADPTAFDLVLRNLISNAAKHHDRQEGEITLRGTLRGGAAEIEVEDDGPGIPEAYQSSIFEPFKRLSADVEGTGLGLSFIQQTVEGWGGSIRVESDGQRGSKFVITLPTGQSKEADIAA
jgi:signal transduction histidine kinase/ABC-type amino acid transport substrate-binding protein